MSTRTTSPSNPSRRAASRFAPAAFVAGALLVATHAAQAQATSGIELRPFVGAYVPTGDQRDFLKDAVLVGGQLSWQAMPILALTANFGWAPSKDRITAGDQTIDILQYDAGAELRGSSWTQGRAWQFTPFVGLGVGGRTYSYRDLDVDSKTNLDGYGALGGELGWGRFGLRVEARDYVSQFKPLTGDGDDKTRNDLALTLGLSYHP